MQTQALNPKPVRDFRSSLFLVAIISAVCGFIYFWLLQFLIIQAFLFFFDSSADLQDAFVSGLAGLLAAAFFFYPIMVFSIVVCGLLAWLGMRLSRVAKAGKIALLASPVLMLIWYLLKSHYGALDLSTPWLHIASFVVVYLILFTILAKK